MSVNRIDLVRSSFEKKALQSEALDKKVSEIFGELVFDRSKMRQYLEPKTFNRLLDCIDNGKPLDRTYIWREMRKLCSLSDVPEEKVYPHNLRALFARTYYDVCEVRSETQRGRVESRTGAR